MKMKPYRTAKSTEGLRLPHSPVILGALAKALRLNSSAHPLYKSAQRYFDGKRIKPAMVDEILVALVDAAVPKGIALPEEEVGNPLELHALAVDSLRSYAQRWDHFVAQVNANLFPVSTPADLPVPVLRLLALDLGIRYGAWLALREVVDGSAPEAPPAGFPDRWFAVYIDRCVADSKLTQEKFAARVGVTTQTLSAWRRGGRKGLPEDTKIAQLARALAIGGETRGVIELELRVMVGVQDLHAQLVHRCGRDRVRDMIDAMLLTAKHVHALWTGPLRSDDAPSMDLLEIAAWREEKEQIRAAMPRRLWSLILYGAECPIGAALCGALARASALRQEVSADFLALPGDWTDRSRYWMQFLGSAPGEMEYMRQHAEETGEFPPDFAEWFVPAFVEGQLRMAGFDQQPGSEMAAVRLDLPPIAKAVNRVIQADRARSMGDLETAIEHMRYAVGHEPMNALHHFKLGAQLGELGAFTRDMALMEAGLAELHIAVQLDPVFGNARNEIGIVLSNMRRHEDAEAAFAQAEPHHGHHAHHWLARGNNYLGLKRYEDARAAYVKAIELSKDGSHLEAKARLAATLMALGKKSEARKLAKDVNHLVGEDPAVEWERFLDVWGDFRFAAKRDESK